MGTVLAVIPSRGGSQELRRKNLLPDAHGVPLVLVSARAARDAGCTVVVSTDDPEIRSLAVIDGHLTVDRPPPLDNGPVDDVVEYHSNYWDNDDPWEGSVLLVQPTVQPVTAKLLEWFLAVCHAQPATGRIVVAEPTALGVEDRHLTWHDGVLLTDRVERQTDTVWPVREVGVRWWPSPPTASAVPQRVITAPEHLVDIDTAADYQAISKRLNIAFQVRANKMVGSGHIRRVLTLAEGLQHHNVSIGLTPDSDTQAEAVLSERGWPTMPPSFVDVWVSDTLGADLAGLPIVSLEDVDGQADVTINAMYGHGDYNGSRYAVLRSEFLNGDYQIRERANRVMVMFGGTDPANLTDLAAAALRSIADEDGGHRLLSGIDIVHPGDKAAVAERMHQADLLITSGGRTVFEAAAVGIPTIVLCQNMRETTHSHLGVGNLDLGLGTLVDPTTLAYTVRRVLADRDLRADLSATAKASIDGHGADRVRRIIEHVGLYGEKP